MKIEIGQALKQPIYLCFCEHTYDLQVASNCGESKIKDTTPRTCYFKCGSLLEARKRKRFSDLAIRNY